VTDRTYDLESRTADFGETIVRFAKSVRITRVTGSLVDQLVRSGTSVGANYLEG
jgi:four helix bundle protein